MFHTENINSYQVKIDMHILSPQTEKAMESANFTILTINLLSTQRIFVYAEKFTSWMVSIPSSPSEYYNKIISQVFLK